MRSLQTILGPHTCDCTPAYVHDIVMHSPTLELHLEHLDAVLRRLTSASFTVGAKKCHFCGKEVTFLGHVTGEGRIVAILNYPLPKNLRQLIQFLEVTNYRQKFAIGDGNYPALLALLKKRIRRRRPSQLQKAFEVLRQSSPIPFSL